MTTTNQIKERKLEISKGEAIEAVDRADWFLQQAAKLLIPPCTAAIFIRDANPDWVLNKVSEAIAACRELRDAFKKAQQ